MSEGCLLRAIVRGLMSDEFLQSSEFADALRPVYEGSPGEGAALAIAGIYDALSTQDAKDALRDRLLRHGHLRKRFTPDGIREIVEFYLIGVEEKNVKIIQDFIGTIVQHLLLFKPAKTFEAARYLQARLEVSR